MDLTFQSLSDFIMDIDLINKTVMERDKECIIKRLLNIYNTQICDHLSYFVFELNPSEIDSLYNYPNNDGEIMCEDLEIDSYTMLIDDNKFICKFIVRQLFNLTFAYEDNEGDRFTMGSAELQVSAIVKIESELKSNKKLDGDFISVDKEDCNFTIVNISYNLITSSSWLD